MKGKDIFKQLLPGMVAGLVLGLILTNLVGVDTENVIPNYIGGIMCILVPTLLNCIIVLKGTAKTLKRKISFKDAIIRTIPYLICSVIIGLIIVGVIIERILGIDTRTISQLVSSIYQTLLGIVFSTLFAYLALKKYASDVKYTRRK